jgi:PAS domain S-box-containing protein
MQKVRKLVAVTALTGAAVLLAYLLHSLVAINFFPLFLAVIFGSAWLFGFRHGLFALFLLLSFTAARQPKTLFDRHTWTPIAIWRFAVFLSSAILLAWLADQLRRARADAAKKAQAEAATQERFRDLIESIDDAFFSVDHDWRIVYSNEKATLLNRLTRDGVLSGRTIWEIFPHIKDTRFEEEYRRAMLERKAATFEAQDRLSGNYYHVRLYPTEQGLSIFFIRHSTEGIWRIELERPVECDASEANQIESLHCYGWLAECNDAMAQMYGYEQASDIIGLRLSAMIVQADPDHGEHLRAFIRSGYRLNDAETHEMDKHGKSHYFLKNLVGIIEDDRLMRIWGTQREITERKLLEQAQLRNAGELARSNEDLAQFAYAASHDLQEPLRTILSFSQLLSRYKDQLEPDAVEYLEYIELASTRMRALIVDLLAFSRVVHSEDAEVRTIDCNQAMQWAVMNLAAAIQEAGACIRYDSLPLVRGDETQIVQLFQNLLSNAIKYRSAEAPAIIISTERQGGDWLFSFRDNGTGIDPRHSSRLFGVFQRFHGKAYPGTGIGLALCKRIVERHRGRIWLESKAGPGSDFRFTLQSSE